MEGWGVCGDLLTRFPKPDHGFEEIIGQEEGLGGGRRCVDQRNTC